MEFCILNTDNKLWLYYIALQTWHKLIVFDAQGRYISQIKNILAFTDK